ncbi:MAG: hypothetical protein M3Y84_12925 [Acidobacteriota bacterium]|nr:hypothetical protein [Acidobacteriota bacterium]
MVKLGAITLYICVCMATLSCQSYTTGLQQSVRKTDDIAAIAALHSIAAAQRTYSLTSGGDYGTFQQLCAGGYLDSRFNSSKPEVKGYLLTMDVSQKSGNETPGSFSCNADPIRADQGGRHFYIDSTSPEIHVNPGQPATAKDGALQP